MFDPVAKHDLILRGVTPDGEHEVRRFLQLVTRFAHLWMNLGYQMSWEVRGLGGVFKSTLDLSKQDIMEHLPVSNSTAITLSRRLWVTYNKVFPLPGCAEGLSNIRQYIYSSTLCEPPPKQNVFLIVLFLDILSWMLNNELVFWGLLSSFPAALNPSAAKRENTCLRHCEHEPRYWCRHGKEKKETDWKKKDFRVNMHINVIPEINELPQRPLPVYCRPDIIHPLSLPVAMGLLSLPGSRASDIRLCFLSLSLSALKKTSAGQLRRPSWLWLDHWASMWHKQAHVIHACVKSNADSLTSVRYHESTLPCINMFL